MNKIIIGISDMAVTAETGVLLATYALGSCVAVIIRDPVSGVSGMLHYLLPESKLNMDKARDNPCTFGDTGIMLLFQSAANLGARKENIIIKVAGGANVLNAEFPFEIGKRNILAARKFFWANNLFVKGHDVGGTVSRTVELNSDTGECAIKFGNKVVGII